MLKKNEALRLFWHLRAQVYLLLVLLSLLVFFGYQSVNLPAVMPSITKFEPDSFHYQAGIDQSIRLNWQLAHVEQIQSLALTSQTERGGLVSKPINFDLSQSLPLSLRLLCQHDPQTLVLTCKNVPTSARTAGRYRFKLLLNLTR